MRNSKPLIKRLCRAVLSLLSGGQVTALCAEFRPGRIIWGRKTNFYGWLLRYLYSLIGGNSGIFQVLQSQTLKTADYDF